MMNALVSVVEPEGRASVAGIEALGSVDGVPDTAVTPFVDNEDRSVAEKGIPEETEAADEEGEGVAAAAGTTTTGPSACDEEGEGELWAWRDVVAQPYA